MTDIRTMDLNADIGEGMARDLELLEIISSASIACGGHAGDDHLMARTLAAARRAGVVTGAHPGFVDRKNFGRKQLDIPPGTIAEQVVEQIRAIRHIARNEGQKISYVKLHGALYNLASRDFDCARTIFKAIHKLDPGLAIMALDNSVQIAAAREIGFATIPEAFADRAYQANGMLLPRTRPGSVFHDKKQAVDQVLSIALHQRITSHDGTVISSGARSICLHGDNEAALKLARAIRDALNEAGMIIRAPAQP